MSLRCSDSDFPHRVMAVTTASNFLALTSQALRRSFAGLELIRCRFHVIVRGHRGLVHGAVGYSGIPTRFAMCSGGAVAFGLS